MSKAKPTYSFRLDPKLIEKARQSHLDVKKLFEKTLSKAVDEEKCPCCGNDLDKGPKKEQKWTSNSK